MANDYFDFLNQGSQQDRPDEPKDDGLVNLTLRADAECKVLCDGDEFVFLEANKIVKEKAPVGEHILEFISIDYPDVCIEKEVSWPEPGKTHLVIIKDFAKAIEEKKTDEIITENEKSPTVQPLSQEVLNRIKDKFRSDFQSYKIKVEDIVIVPGQDTTVFKVVIPDDLISSVRALKDDLLISLNWNSEIHARIISPIASVDIEVQNNQFEPEGSVPFTSTVPESDNESFFFVPDDNQE